MINKLEKYDFITILEKEEDGLRIAIGGQNYKLITGSNFSLYQTHYFSGNTTLETEPVRVFQSEDEVVSFFDGINFGKRFDFTNI